MHWCTDISSRPLRSFKRHPVLWCGGVPAFAQGGTIPKFADGGLIGRAAGGIMIPGNSMSGDNLRLPVDGGRGMIGVNSGELILNRAQQGNLASQLEGGGMENLLNKKLFFMIQKLV